MHACNVGPLPAATAIRAAASEDSLFGLADHDAASLLTDLKVRRFVDSPATPDCIHALCHAPIGFAGSLTELHLELDTWREQDATTAPLKPYPRASRVAVLHTLSQLRNLERLKIRGWGALVGVDCDGGCVLRQLKNLTRVEVERYPCGSCVVDCLHFHADLPFQSMENM